MSAQNALTRWRLRHKKGLFAKYLSSSFSPPDRANLVGWWDASAITGLANNDPVSSWTDKSGLGNHATQSTGSLKPTYKTNQQNGLAGISFDGGDVLALPFSSFPSAEITIILAAKITDGTYERYFIGGNGTTETYPLLFTSTDDGKYYWRDSGWNNFAALATDIVCIAQKDATSLKFITHSGTSSTVVPSVAISGVGLTNFGAGSNAGFKGIGGLVFECFVYKSQLGASNIDIIMSYLANKWSI